MTLSLHWSNTSDRPAQDRDDGRFGLLPHPLLISRESAAQQTIRHWRSPPIFGASIFPASATPSSRLVADFERIGMRVHDHPVILDEDNRVLGRLTVVMDFVAVEIEVDLVVGSPQR